MIDTILGRVNRDDFFIEINQDIKENNELALFVLDNQKTYDFSLQNFFFGKKDIERKLKQTQNKIDNINKQLILNHINLELYFSNIDVFNNLCEEAIKKYSSIKRSLIQYLNTPIIKEVFDQYLEKDIIDCSNNLKENSSELINNLGSVEARINIKEFLPKIHIRSKDNSINLKSDLVKDYQDYIFKLFSINFKTNEHLQKSRDEIEIIQQLISSLSINNKSLYYNFIENYNKKTDISEHKMWSKLREMNLLAMTDTQNIISPQSVKIKKKI